MVGWPTDLFFVINRQKRGHVPNLDSLKKELWIENLDKKRKKTQKNELGQAPTSIFFSDKPIGALPDRDYVLTRMVIQII